MAGSKEIRNKIKSVQSTRKITKAMEMVAASKMKKALAADKSLRDHLKGKYAALVKTMEDKKDLSADDEKALKAAIEDWKKTGSF